MEREKQSIPSPCLVKKELGHVVSMLCERDFIVVNLGAICEGIMYVCGVIVKKVQIPMEKVKNNMLRIVNLFRLFCTKKYYILHTYLKERVSYLNNTKSTVVSISDIYLSIYKTIYLIQTLSQKYK